MRFLCCVMESLLTWCSSAEEWCEQFLADLHYAIVASEWQSELPRVEHRPSLTTKVKRVGTTVTGVQEMKDSSVGSRIKLHMMNESSWIAL